MQFSFANFFTLAFTQHNNSYVLGFFCCCVKCFQFSLPQTMGNSNNFGKENDVSHKILKVSFYVSIFSLARTFSIDVCLFFSARHVMRNLRMKQYLQITKFLACALQEGQSTFEEILVARNMIRQKENKLICNNKTNKSNS